MDVKEKSKKRELIKTIAIIFLVVLLLLTFFSQTIMNRSLPEVATQIASSGSINAKIRGSGTVAANESYEVSIKQTREVRSVCVKVGQRVEEGDLLFVLGDIESQELKTAQEALENARLDYQRKVLELSKMYAADDQNVKTIREDLEAAYAKRDANYVTDDEVSLAKGDLAAAKSGLNQIKLAIEQLEALQKENEDYATAKEKVTELESKVKSLEGAIETYEADLEKLGNGDDVATDRKIRDAEDALQKAEYAWRSDWLAYKTDLAKLFESVNKVDGYNVGTLDINSDTPPTLSLQQQMYIEAFLTDKVTPAVSGIEGGDTDTLTERAGSEEPPSADYTKWSKAYNALLSGQQDVESKTQTLQRLRQDSNNASSDAYQQRREIQNKIDEAQSDLATAQRDLRTAQAAMNAASDADAQLKGQIRLQEDFQRQQEATITALEENLEALEEKQKTYKAALETVSAKERELETTLSGKDIDKQLDNLSLQSMSMDIQKYEEQVEKYRKDSVDAEVISPVSGVITAISVTAGKETTPDAAMATIDVVDRGYTIKVSVTNEQAKQVKVGDTAEVTNYYWGNDITATLEQIAADPASAGQKKLLVFRLTGDIDAGTNISLSIGQRSATYDTIIPKSALREDSNGKFVYVITSKNTPLGNRYTATRVDVQVLAEDDTSAAVSGLSQNDYVITTSSKPLDAGSQVRMVENP